jgi:excisionase family DNA binding protein
MNEKSRMGRDKPQVRTVSLCLLVRRLGGRQLFCRTLRASGKIGVWPCDANSCSLVKRRKERNVQMKKTIKAKEKRRNVAPLTRRALSMDEVEETTGVSRYTLRRMIDAGTLKAAFFGRRIVIPTKELENLLRPAARGRRTTVQPVGRRA